MMMTGKTTGFTAQHCLLCLSAQYILRTHCWQCGVMAGREKHRVLPRCWRKPPIPGRSTGWCRQRSTTCFLFVTAVVFMLHRKLSSKWSCFICSLSSVSCNLQPSPFSTSIFSQTSSLCFFFNDRFYLNKSDYNLTTRAHECHL